MIAVADEPATEDAIGIVGGMGPAATAYFYETIVTRTPEETDQDHLRVIVDSNPKIPDRTAYLTGDGPDPRPSLLETARNVEAAGADFLTVPCNTAHAFHDDLSAAVDVPVLHMIDLAARRVGSNDEYERVGLLATDGTIDLGIYHERLADQPVELATPEPRVQEWVMEALYRVKSGESERPRELLVDAVDAFDGVDAVIAGCTEVPLAFDREAVDVPLVDPMMVMADEAIARAKPELAAPG